MLCRATGLSHHCICLAMSCKVVKQRTHLPPLYPPATPQSKLQCSFSRRGGLNREVQTLDFHPFSCFFFFKEKKSSKKGSPSPWLIVSAFSSLKSQIYLLYSHWQGRRDSFLAALKPGHPRISLLTQPLHMSIV